MDFLSHRLQRVIIGNNTSSILILNTGTPQGCVLRPMLFTLFTLDFPNYTSNSIIKLVDNTTVVGLIIDNEETAYRLEVNCLARLFEDNNLVLNTSKAKELIIDFRRTKGRDYHPSTYMVMRGNVSMTSSSLESPCQGS